MLFAATSTRVSSPVSRHLSSNRSQVARPRPAAPAGGRGAWVVDAHSVEWSTAAREGRLPLELPRWGVRSVRELPPGVREGEVFEGKYRIGKVLDSGAMGTVVAAHHLSLDQKVAIKFLRSDALPFAGRVERLVREARATAGSAASTSSACSTSAMERPGSRTS